MSYLLKTTEENRRGRRNVYKTVFIVLVLLLLSFATPLRNFLSPVAIKIIEPFFSVSLFLKDKTIFFLTLLRPEASLAKENIELRFALEEANTKLLDYARMKEEVERVLGIQNEDNLESVIARVIRRPDSTPYDTILIDAGNNRNVEEGDIVFSSEIPIGIVEYSYSRTARVKLYSTPGESHEVLIGEDNIPARGAGRGGGNFEVFLPRGAKVSVGDRVILPEVSSRAFAFVEDVVETQGGTFIRVLFKNPISFSELRYLSISKNTE